MILLLAAALAGFPVFHKPVFNKPAVAPPSVTLAWAPSSSPGVTGYKIYQGVIPRVYTNAIDVGAATTFTFTNLNRGVPNYFAATAYYNGGIESDYSAEVGLIPPPPPTNVVTFKVQILTAPGVNDPYVVLTNLTACSVTNPVGADFVRATVSVVVTNIAK